MTKAIFKFSNNLFQSLEVSGHSGYQTYGSDIVCSAISTAVFTTINLIDKKYGNNSYHLIQKEDKGYLFFEMIKIEDIDFVNLVFDNLYDMLKDIEKDYQKFLQVKKENNN